LPSADLTELHRRIGEGGTGMTTIAYCAAENNGRPACRHDVHG
jgi:hypothetical protein